MESSTIVFCVALLVLKLTTQVLGANVCTKWNGYVMQNLVCGSNYGSEMKDGVMCCLPCKKACPQEGYARVDDSLTNTANGRCLGTCMKCSEITTPVRHYKNDTTQSCQQCRNCRLHGLSELTECGDTYNTQCATNNNYANPIHDVTNTPKNQPSSTTTHVLPVVPSIETTSGPVLFYRVIRVIFSGIVVCAICVICIICVFLLKTKFPNARNNDQKDVENVVTDEELAITQVQNAGDENTRNEKCENNSSGHSPSHGDAKHEDASTESSCRVPADAKLDKCNKSLTSNLPRKDEYRSLPCNTEKNNSNEERSTSLILSLKKRVVFFWRRVRN